MTEIARLVSLFEKLYDGEPWIDVNIVSNLQNITAGQASKKVLTNCNSIWEITNHLIEWRLNVLKRVEGKTIQTPANNFFEEVKDPSNEAWEDTLKRLDASQQQWLSFLKNLKEIDLEKTYPKNNMTYYEHIQGIIQHDAYHLGQIVLLSKFI
jgi:uncharacterized damage-inducible protein DinB